MLRNEGEPLTWVAVSAPGAAYSTVEDLTAHNIFERADSHQAVAQHRALRETLAGCGAEVLLVPELAGHPNSVFTQDVALAVPDGFIRLRMGLPTRAGEPAWMAAALTAAGLPEVGRIEPPGTLEGGDVILAGSVAFVGRSARTNDAGIQQLAPLLEQRGYALRVAAVPDSSLHIGGMMSVIGPGQVLACREQFPPGFFQGFEVITIPQESFISGNVITLGRGEVIAEHRNASAIAALRAVGFIVHALDLSEFVKGSGGPSCLILPLARG